MKKRIVALMLTLLMVFSVAAASAAYYRVNTSSLRVRQFDDESALTIASRERDFAFTVKKKTQSGKWLYVKFTNGDEGYVMSKYTAKSSSYSAWITSDGTPIRSGPAWDYSNVGTLARGAKVTVLSHGTKYDYVKSSVGYGYVMNGFLSKKKVKASGNKSEPAVSSENNYTAYVSNGTRSVNFRLEPSTSAPVIDTVATGTQITVLKHVDATWAYVQIGSDTGYMMARFITKSEPAVVPSSSTTPSAPSTYTAYVTSENKKGVNVRSGPGIGHTFLFKAAYGSKVTVLEHGKNWDKIEQDGKKGYMQNKFLKLTKPDDASTVSTTPSTPSVSYPYAATTVCKEGEKVNFRVKPWATSTARFRLDPGTSVTVTGPAKYNGKTYTKWVAVEYDGVSGFMMKEFLK